MLLSIPGLRGSRLVVSACLVVLASCGGEESASAGKEGEPAAARSTEMSVSASPADATLSSAPPEATMSPAGSVSWGRVTAAVPEGWVEETPDNPMRAAQYKLPRAKGDREDGEVVLTYFGKSQGGSLEMNRERWAGMIRPEGGGSAMDAMKTETFEVGTLSVTIADLEGTYIGSISPMNPAAGKHDKPSFRLFNAVISSPDGNHYLKALGPQKTLEQWMPSIRGLLGSVEPAK